MDFVKVSSPVLEFGKENRNATIITEEAFKMSDYYATGTAFTDTTSSLRNDIDELKDYLNKKKRRITVRVRI